MTFLQNYCNTVTICLYFGVFIPIINLKTYVEFLFRMNYLVVFHFIIFPVCWSSQIFFHMITCWADILVRERWVFGWKITGLFFPCLSLAYIWKPCLHSLILWIHEGIITFYFVFVGSNMHLVVNLSCITSNFLIAAFASYKAADVLICLKIICCPSPILLWDKCILLYPLFIYFIMLC